MSKIRDKLRALNAPRPKDLGEGRLVAEAPTGLETPKLRPAETPPTRQRASAPSEATPDRNAPSAQTLPSATTAKTRPAVALPAARKAPSPTPHRPPIPHRQTFPRSGAGIVRAGSLQAWKDKKWGDTPAAAAQAQPEARTRKESRGAPPSESPGAPYVVQGVGAGTGRHLVEAMASPHVNWATSRKQVEALLAEGEVAEAREILETMVLQATTDPFPFLALAKLLQREDPARAAALRAQAQRLAPWV